MSAPITAALDALAEDVLLSVQDRAETADVVARIERLLAHWGAALTPDRRLALTAHTLAFTRRVRGGDPLPPLDPELFDELPPEVVRALRDALAPYCTARGVALSDDEVLLFATHVELSRTP